MAREYLVQPKVFANNGYWKINNANYLSPDTAKRLIGGNLRELEIERPGSLRFRQLIRGVDVLGGINEEIRREYIAPTLSEHEW